MSAPETVDIRIGSGLLHLQRDKSIGNVTIESKLVFLYGGFSSSMLSAESQNEIYFEAIYIDSMKSVTPFNPQLFVIGDTFEILGTEITFLFISLVMKENRPCVTYIPDVDKILHEESKEMHPKDLIRIQELDANGITFWLSLNRCDRYASEVETSLKIFSHRVFCLHTYFFR
jgi:hypothetical protein